MIFKPKKTLSSILKHRLILQQYTNTPDALGGFTRGWSDVATLWAEITPISGSEKYSYQQQVTRGRYRIKLRYRNDINPKMRLYDAAQSRVFDIKSVINPHEASRVTEIIADISV